MAPKTQEGELSEKEKAILGYAWKCFDSEPKVDYEKLAGLGGYTNPKSAANILAAAKKKLKTFAGGNADGNGEESVASSSKATPAKKRATPKGKKRNAAEANGTNEDEVETPTPKKLKKALAKSAAKKGKPVKVEDEVEEDNDEKEVMAEDTQADSLDDGEA
ncbi:hypothetical protein CHU98_g10482 [Xylaria longipes]|nr:hypothetical protein CHU98_g10482 [Xylaria longipes]